MKRISTLPLLGIFFTFLLMLNAMPQVVMASPHHKFWTTLTPISGGSLATPSSITVGPNDTIWVGVDPAGDMDHWVIASPANEADEADSITYSWNSGSGSFTADPLYPDGRAKFWTASATTGTYTVSCTIDDVAHMEPLEWGNRDDFSVTRNITVHVVTSGYWKHKSWIPGEVQWKRGILGTLEVSATDATEVQEWVGSPPQNNKNVPVAYQTAIDPNPEVTLTANGLIYRAKFVAHSSVGGPDNNIQDSRSVFLEQGSDAACATGNCPPGVPGETSSEEYDQSDGNLKTRVTLSGQLAVFGNSVPQLSSSPSPSARGALTATVDIPPTTWRISYDVYLEVDSTTVKINFPDNTSRTYTASGSSFISEAGDFTTLQHVSGDQYKVLYLDGSSETYDIPSGSTFTTPMLMEMEDQFGNTTVIDRNTTGQIIKITDPIGQETILAYTSGRLTSVTDPYNDVATLVYDVNGYLTNVTSTEGQTVVYGYDSNGAVNSVTDAQGTRTYVREIGDGTGALGFDRRITMTNADGGKTEYYFDATNQRSWKVNPEDWTSDNSNPSVPKTYSAIDPDPNNKARIGDTWNADDEETKIDYDPVTGLPLVITDPLGRETTFTYNAQGQVTSVTDDANNTITYTYAVNGIDLLNIKDPDNNIIASFTHGTNHEILTATDAYSNTTTYTYTVWGDVATIEDANGIVTEYTYNTDRLITLVEVDSLTTSSMTYDAKLRLRTATDGDGITLTYDYDDSDRVSKITAPDSTFETYEYLGDTSLITEYTDRAGRESTFTYDANGNRLTATDPELNLVQFDYDANGQLTLLTDAKGNETTWQYDVLGRTIRKDYDDGNFEQYFYDAANQLTSYRQPNASVIAYEYDTRGNVTKVDYPSMADVTFTYDNMNRAVTMTDALGTTTNAYDLMSRPTSSGGLWANDAVTYDYDNLGRRSELALNSRTVTFGYDNLSRLNEVNRGTDAFTYTYKSNGSQLDEVDLPNGAKSTFSYDGLGRLTQIQDLKSTAANISKFAYGYDNRDVKIHMERALGTATTQRINYTYDDIDQLLTEISTELTPVVNNNFTYDAAQNRTASTVDAVNSSFSINNVNQISAYTLGGSPVTVTHDDNGNTTQLGPKVLTWDDANRVTSVTVPGVSKSEYQYDGLDRRRIAKAYTWNGGTSSWDLQSERRFIYDGMNLIEERDGSNTLIAFYTRTGNIGSALSRTTSSATFYYHYDGDGNVVSLSDANENVVATYAYDAYGNVRSMSGAQAADNPLRFSTKYFDTNTGYYDFGFRSYDSATGRWLNRDPIGEDGGLNLYGFVGNSPGNVWDEYGLSPFDVWKRKINEWLFGKPQKTCSNEDPAWSLAKQKARNDQHAIKRGAQMAEAYANIMYNEIPKQLIVGSVIGGLSAIGRAGSRGIREVPGGAKHARRLFDALRGNSPVRKVSVPGKPDAYIAMGKHGKYVTFRASSKSGPATVDVPGLEPGLRKIKFLRNYYGK